MLQDLNNTNYYIHYCMVNLTRFLHLLQKGKKDAVNFDTEFTKEEPVLTPINPEVVLAINQDEFRGFSCVNPAFKSAAAAPCQA